MAENRIVKVTSDRSLTIPDVLAALSGDSSRISQTITPEQIDAIKQIAIALTHVGDILGKMSTDNENGSERSMQLIRHGATALNNDDVSVDRIRGWKDIPLSRDGKEEAERLGEKMKDMGDLPDVIVSSDLKRACETAEIISRITGVPLDDISRDFRPWNVGDLSGEVSKKAIPVLADYAENRPTKDVPGGESFDDFKARFFGGLERVMKEYPGKKIAVVTHHRGERLVKAWLKAGHPDDGEIDIAEFNQKGEHTGSIEEILVPERDVEMAERRHSANGR